MLTLGYYGCKVLKPLITDKPQDTNKSLAKDLIWNTSDLLVTGLALGVIGVGMAAFFFAPGIAAFLGIEGTILMAIGGGVLLTSILGGAIIQHLAKKQSHFSSQTFHPDDTYLTFSDDTPIILMPNSGTLRATLCTKSDVDQFPSARMNEISQEMQLFRGAQKKPLCLKKVNLTEGDVRQIDGPHSTWETGRTWMYDHEFVRTQPKKEKEKEIEEEEEEDIVIQTTERVHGWAEKDTCITNYCYSGGSDKAVFGFVFDEASSDKTSKFNQIFNTFYSQFAQMVEYDLAHTKTFQSLAETQGFVRLELLKLIHLIQSDNKFLGTITPSMSFALVVQIEEKKYLLSAQYGDTFIALQQENSSKILTNESERTPHHLNAYIHGPHAYLPKIHVNEVNESDEIYLFSRGIGQYLTSEEVFEVINMDEEKFSGLEDFKDKINSQTSRDSSSTTKGANGKPLIALDPSSFDTSNDLGLVCITI